MRINPLGSETLFFRELGANGDRIVWIDGAGLFFDGLDDTFLVDNKSSALRPIIFFFLDVVHFQNTVLFQHFAIHVAKQGEGDPNFLRESVVGGGTIDANSKDDRVRCFELGHISLIGLKFFRSTFGEGENVEGQDDIFSAAVVAKMHLLPLVVEQRKVRSHVAGLQGGVVDFAVLLRVNRSGDQATGQGCRKEHGLQMRRTHERLLVEVRVLSVYAAKTCGVTRLWPQTAEFTNFSNAPSGRGIPSFRAIPASALQEWT